MMKVLIVGSGLAGLTAALHAHEAGHDVTVVTKGQLGDGCTALAQGGVAGVYGPGDSKERHAADTMQAGAGEPDPAAVDVLVTDGGARIAELIARGVAFDRFPDGTLRLGREAAHSHARIAHAGGDATGAAISRALSAAVRRTSIRVIEHAFLTELLVAGGAVRGIRMLSGLAESEIGADVVILATGGAGQLYAHTTNPLGTTGDGIAAAQRAGAALTDLEFVQFHPTVLASGSAFLISEAVRGEGATLVDRDGRRFAFDSHPDGELAPRDVVARAIARQAADQRSPVHLDATTLGVKTLAVRFPTIDRVTRERGFDWSRDPVPVTPAAHYLMGGVVTDLDGRTTVPGLFAVGEAARTGVHGANRLASNSLLEAAVFGARAAAAVGAPWRFVSLRSLNDQGPRSLSDTGPRSLHDQGTGPVVERGAQRPDETPRPGPFSREALQRMMWDHVGLLRTDQGLAHAVRILRTWMAGARTPHTIADHEDANLLLLAEATASAALARTASIGAHHRHTDAHVRPATSILETV
ncbi:MULTISPECIES: L-aspartate oxidase [unclassified Microbacterium]|uniref:L-aspartate oxidase n=1 Tax=unclassified Microbacterium TaxID=2609290 RepID=UPI000EA92038|nr:MULTISPECIES: L-aspartate oxidase [unclassified Microbacterium]MBT2485308.1 L-aspartate oxidase [Microbacterium sp. ISL-108]RKN68117.1 L-aspartate oxidase [Microbacterium sp. CGR2]